MKVAPNYQIAILWTTSGKLAFYNLTQMAVVGSYIFANPPGIGVTSVAFSNDSSLAVIETDTANPITIF